MYRLQSLRQSLCHSMGHRLQAPQETVNHETAAPQGVSTPARVAHRGQSLQQCLTCSPECTQECPCPTVAFTAGSPFEEGALVASTAQKCTLPCSSSHISSHISSFFLLFILLHVFPICVSCPLQLSFILKRFMSSSSTHTHLTD